MTYEFKAIITDELPGVNTVVVRTWMTKAGSEQMDERAFLMPKDVKLTDKNPFDMIVAAADQTRQKIIDEKSAPKKRTPKKTEEM